MCCPDAYGGSAKPRVWRVLIDAGKLTGDNSAVIEDGRKGKKRTAVRDRPSGVRIWLKREKIAIAQSQIPDRYSSISADRIMGTAQRYGAGSQARVALAFVRARNCTV